MTSQGIKCRLCEFAGGWGALKQHFNQAHAERLPYVEAIVGEGDAKLVADLQAFEARRIVKWLDEQQVARLNDQRETFDFEAPDDGPGQGGVGMRHLKSLLDPVDQ